MTNKLIVGIDLGNTMGMAKLEEGIITSTVVKRVTIKKLIKILDDYIKTDNALVVTALPNIFGKFRYNIIINQSKQLGVIESQYDIEVIKEASANKSIVGKGRAKKEEVMESIQDKGFNPATHDEADALKFLLHYLDTNGIDYNATE